mmetsp:Transcript_26962/g.52046  ORF Transcript_26962/g.52046 Transcript_26962/m.52046 type:complete len:202 (+) Transcript_26962:113-718(+)
MPHVEAFPALPGEQAAAEQAALLQEVGRRLEEAATSPGYTPGTARQAIESSIQLQAAIVAAADEVSDENRKLADARFALGEALVQQENDLIGGAAEFCQALMVNPWHPDAICGIASVLGELGDLEGAVQTWRRSLIVAPRHGLTHFYLGSALGRQGDLEGALAEFRAVVEYDPDSPAAALARKNIEAVAALDEEEQRTPDT